MNNFHPIYDLKEGEVSLCFMCIYNLYSIYDLKVGEVFMVMPLSSWQEGGEVYICFDGWLVEIDYLEMPIFLLCGYFVLFSILLYDVPYFLEALFKCM